MKTQPKKKNCQPRIPKPDTPELESIHSTLDPALESRLIAQASTPDGLTACLVAGIEPHHFDDEANAAFYSELLNQKERGDEIDSLTAALKLRDAKLIDDTDSERLLDATRLATYSIQAEAFAAELIKVSVNRETKALTRRASLYLKDENIEKALELLEQVNGLRDSTAGPSLFPDLKELWELKIEFTRPTIGIFAPGRGLFYERSSNYLFGPPAVSKTWLALHIAAELMRDAWHVVYIDPESTAKNILWRLKYIGIDPVVGSEYFHYLGTTDAAQIEKAQRWAAKHEKVFVIYDGLANAIAALGREENSSAALEVLQKQVKPFIDAGATTLTIDHTGKDEDKGARGHSSKLAFFKGAAYQLKKGQPFARGQSGFAKIVLAKDNEGGTAIVPGKTAAVFRATTDETGKTIFTLDLPSDDDETAGPGRSVKMTDEEIWKSLPVGPDRAMSFAGIAPALNVKTFTAKCREMVGVTVEQRKKANGKFENVFFRTEGEF